MEAAQTPGAVQDELPGEDMPGDGADLQVVKGAAAPVPYRGVMSDDELRRTWRTAAALAQSKMFPDAQEAAQAFAKILMGHDLGLSPTQAMQGIHIVEGKPMLHYATLGGFVRARDGYDYRKVEQTAERCVLEWTRDNWASVGGEWSFTIEEAKQAGLKFTGKGGGDTNWKKRPKVMLFARALSQGVREDMPEVLGGIPVYVEGEIEPGGGEHRRIEAGEEVQGLDLGPKVEAVLIRAENIGHMGLASRASAEMALGDQSPQVVDLWVANATRELDAVDPGLCRAPAEDGRLCVLEPEHDPPHKARAGEAWTDDEKPDGEPAEKEDPGNGDGDGDEAAEAEDAK